MRIEEVYKIIAESYEEQQIIQTEFPGVWFDVRGGLRNPTIIFYIPKNEESKKFVEEREKK